MSHFSIGFAYPWLLLLFVPAIFLTLFPYFRLQKKYRRTRNRIISLVLHLAIMTLSICVLSGIVFLYQVPNLENEVLLLVDVSFSGEEKEEARNEFIRTVLDESGETFKIGIVTFGYTQVYAAELSYDTDEVYREYLAAARPDDSATDISSALNYARGLFERPETAKIVLISDGAETDGNAAVTIKSVAADGIRVDTVCFPAEHEESEVQIVNVAMPDYNITVGESFNIEMTVQSSVASPAHIKIIDNDVASETVQTVDLSRGVQTVTLTHAVSLPGLHKLCFELESDTDSLKENNTYYSYLFLNVFEKILIVERNEGESDSLRGILEEVYETTQEGKDNDNVKVLNVASHEMPSTLNELRQYDQVILMNIANADLPEGFDEILHSYVYDIGGGLFTVGGNKTDASGAEVANAYDREDMYGTLYQEMLPVQAIDYTPPLGLMIIIDRSGSMGVTDSATGKSKLELAKDGAKSCLGVLTERDWVGIMTLESSYSEEAEMMPMQNISQIRSVIENIEIGGGTVYGGAIEYAGRALTALNGVERRHIILVSDAQPGDKLEEYGAWIAHYNETAGITFSIVGIGVGSEDMEDMRTAAEEYGKGRFYPISDPSDISFNMRNDINIPEIKAYNPEPFTPTIEDHTPVVNGITESEIPQLGGFYGTKKKAGAEVALTSEYAPIYAQWKYGEGMVGSFMCDLSGRSTSWSREFLSSAVGERFLRNVVSALFPTKDIRPQEVDATLTEDNYTTQLNIYTEIEEGDSVTVTVRGPSSDGTEEERTFFPAATEGYSRVTFPITTPGLHEIVVQKQSADGSVASHTLYRSFAYSEEYNMFLEEEAGRLFLEELAERGRGSKVNEAWEIFDEYVRTLDRSYDPRLPFIIAAIVLFLLDIAVRKFKFKWIHEIVHDYKAKKELGTRGGGK